MKAVAAMLLFVACLPVASADWLQEGHDAARTGHADGSGPGVGDVAVQTQFPLPVVPHGSPIIPMIIGGTAYILISGYDDPGTGPDAMAGPNATIYAIDLASGDWRMVGSDPVLSAHDIPTDSDAKAIGWASDGTRFFIQHNTWLSSVDLKGQATPGWPYPRMNNYPGEEITFTAACYPNPVLSEGRVFVACEGWASPAPGPNVFVTAFDAGSGDPAWPQPNQTWYKDTQVPELYVFDPADPTAPRPGGRTNIQQLPDWQTTELSGLSVVGSNVFLAMYEGFYEGDGFGNQEVRRKASTWGIDAEAGTTEFFWGQDSVGGMGGAPAIPLINWMPAPTGDETRLFLESAQLLVFDQQNLWDAAEPVDFRPVRFEGDPGSGMAFDGTNLYVTTRDSLLALDPGLSEMWRFTPNSETWAPGSLAVTDKFVYGVSTTGTSYTLHALDRTSGALAWSHQFPGAIAFGVDGDVAVAVGVDGVVTILGRTPYSLVAEARPTSQYPEVAESVRVDLGGSRPGRSGAATQYRADWGDGAVSEWQASPRFEHRYNIAEDRLATFDIANDHNQTSSAQVMFYVGRDDPGRTFLEKAFDDENQEQSFFILGLLVTALFALFGFWRLGRRRERLRREMASLESAFEEARARPSECERLLSDRRARARSLVLGGKLDEGQAALLERRVDELRARLRLGTMDRRLHFLPHGLVLTLTEHLRDGTLNAWERDHLVDALEKDRVLSKRQKDEVRAMIDGWFAHDAGGSG